jgi:hypothetical protein
MWGKFYVRPAEGLRLIWILRSILEIYLRFYNTAGVTRTKCRVKFVTPAVFSTNWDIALSMKWRECGAGKSNKKIQLN